MHLLGCPLVMAIISAVIRRHPSDIDKSLKMCLNKLKDKSLIIFQHKSPYQYPCIEQALKMSVDSLQEEKEHYFDLAIFPNEFYIYGQVTKL